jgi:hypothetical protein
MCRRRSSHWQDCRGFRRLHELPAALCCCGSTQRLIILARPPGLLPDPPSNGGRHQPIKQRRQRAIKSTLHGRTQSHKHDTRGTCRGGQSRSANSPQHNHINCPAGGRETPALSGTSTAEPGCAAFSHVRTELGKARITKSCPANSVMGSLRLAPLRIKFSRIRRLALRRFFGRTLHRRAVPRQRRSGPRSALVRLREVFILEAS